MAGLASVMAGLAYGMGWTLAWLAGPQAWLTGPQAWLDGPKGGGRMDKRTDIQKISLFYRTLSAIGAAALLPEEK